MSEDIKMFAMCLWVLVCVMFIGAVIGAEIGPSKDDTLNIACASACERLDSEVESRSGNVCLCKNLRVMRGDYGQLFLKGENQ